MRILHVISEKTWRGGENQVRLLLENAREDWFVAAPAGSEASRRLGKNAQIFAIEMGGLHLLTAARTLAQLVDAHGIQLVDCQSSRGHNLGLLLKWLRPRLKLVVHRRVDFPPGRGFFNRRKYLSPAVDRYICISAAIAAVLRGYGVAEERLSVVPSAVDPAPFLALDKKALRGKWRKLWQLPDDVPIIANVAYLTPQKDHATLLRALARVKADGHRFFCFIAGGGELEKAHKELAAVLGLGAAELQFLGVRKDVPELLAAADIFALSSADEGLGTSLLDATHSGLALVATAVGGIPEIIIDGQTGLLAARGDHEHFARQLQRLLGDPELRARLNRAAQVHAHAHFSLASMVEGNCAVYRSLLEGPAPLP